jgi:hypothetical protein
MSAPLLLMETSHPTLILGNIPITRDSQRWIIRKAGEVPIQEYYKEKYRWDAQIFHDIDWEVQQKALLSFTESDQCRILKFVSGWLPTNKRLYREGIEKSPRCQLCNSLEEHNDHLLTRSRDIQEHTRQKIIDYIWRDNTNHGNSELNNIIELALSESAHKETWQPLAGETSLELRKCIIHQNKIGWNQLVKGRITKEMRKTMDNHYQKLNLNTRKYTGERWCKLLIKNIWQVILQLWKQRNEIIHDSVSASQLSKTQERMATRVHQCYEWKDTLTLEDRERIFYTDANQLLQEDQ